FSISPGVHAWVSRAERSEKPGSPGFGFPLAQAFTPGSRVPSDQKSPVHRALVWPSGILRVRNSTFKAKAAEEAP
ncbi:MAG: hypothetical protein AABN33_28090, partial [Acidobacteriota bacterium]